MTPIKLTLSRDGSCLDERSMQQMYKLRDQFIRLRHESIDGEVSKRWYYPILISGATRYADCATGTLYDAATGERSSGSPQGRIVLDAELKVTRKRKDVRARESEGWMNEARRAAS